MSAHRRALFAILVDNPIKAPSPRELSTKSTEGVTNRTTDITIIPNCEANSLRHASRATSLGAGGLKEIL